MGSHFHNRIQYNGVTFLVELLQWGHIFRTDYNGVRFLVELLQWGRIFTTELTIMGLHF